MKRLLVTGGAGFIGCNFIRYIIDKYRDYQIVNLDKLTYAGNLENLRDIEGNPNYRFVKGDICDEGIVDKLVKDCDVMIHFASETHVDRSISDPTNFMQTNVHGTYVLLEAAKKHDLDKFIQVSCYDEETRAMTTEGLKTYKKLIEGDLVFSLNPKTREIEVKPIEKVIVQSYQGKMIHFKNQRIDLLVTPNHNMFILDTAKKNLHIEPAGKISKRSIFYMPEGRWLGKEEEYFNVKNYGRVKTKDLLYILGIFIGDGFTAYQEKEAETKTGLAREDYLEKSRDKKTGRFKSIEKQSNYKAKMRGYRIFFDIPEDDRCRKRVEATLSSLGVGYHRHKGKAGTHLYFTSKIFMELFNQCGQGAHNKHIPRWALEYSPKYLKYLLEGLMDSDGSKGRIYHTASERLATDICELCIKLNLKPSIHRRHTRSFIKGRKIEGDSYYIFIANTAKSISHHKNSIIDYNGVVWCLKVKDNKNFIVERNGRFDFCGNTDEVYGSVEEGSSSEEDNLRPTSPYSASKAAADLLAGSYFTTYGLPVIIVRSSNNFGPYQYPEKIISLFITNALDDRPLPLYGDGLNIRDWLYVMDNCEAIGLILHEGGVGEIYNVGAGNERTNKEITDLILKRIGKPASLIRYVEDRPGHDRRYALDCTKIRKLGWRPRHTFEDGIDKTIDWYQKNRDWWEKLKERLAREGSGHWLNRDARSRSL